MLNNRNIRMHFLLFKKCIQRNYTVTNNYENKPIFIIQKICVSVDKINNSL